MAAPLCSVVIPTYNRGRYLERAIRSVLDQMLPGDELIVVDDGSVDDTPQVLAGFGDRIIVVPGPHGGAGRARNHGIALAKNDLVAFLDSDDIWLPGKLELQRRLMANRPELLYCFGNFEVVHGDGSLHSRYLDRWPREHGTWEEGLGPGAPYSSYTELPKNGEDFLVYEGDFYSLQLTGFYVLTDTLMVRREAAGDALSFAEDLPTYEDLECFYRLARAGRGALLDVELARQFDHEDGRLSRHPALEKLDARLALVRRHWGDDPGFLSREAGRYQQTLDHLLCLKAGHLVTRGLSRQAREALREAHAAPLALRALVHVPTPLTLLALRALRGVRALAGARSFS